MLREVRATVKVLESNDKWYGITYQEDKEKVKEYFKMLVDNGVYPAKLWS